MIAAQIVADSINPVGDRLTCFLLKLPHFISPELLRHRSLSFCSESARARPISKMISAVWNEPVIPLEWGSNQPGMQAGAEIPKHKRVIAEYIWRTAGIVELVACWLLGKVGLHKQTSNRRISTDSYITILVQGTDFGNFFNLRCDKMAQPEMRALAYRMLEEYVKSTPVQLKPLEWHLPFADKFTDGLSTEDKIKISVARCARTSYKNQDGQYSHEKDFELFHRLAGPGHFSPMEFPAQCLENSQRSGNLTGWLQYRKTIQGENREKFDAAKLLSLR